MLGTRCVSTARMRDDPTGVFGRYDILRLLPIAAIPGSSITYVVQQ